MLLPADGGEAKPFLVTPFNEQTADIAPNGAWVLYLSDESGTPQLYVQSFPTPGGKQQVTKSGSFFGLWSGTGREIFSIRLDGMIVSIPVVWDGRPRFGNARELYRAPTNTSGWNPTPDGERFLVSIPAEQRVPGISIAVNWRAGREK